MVYSTKLLSFLSDFSLSLRERYFNLQNRFPVMICLLLVGFLIGNMFCTLLPTIRGILPWDGAILVVLIVLIELVSYARYNKEERPRLFLTPAPFRWTIKFKWSNLLFWRFVNQFKIGVLVGFFVDAFKVGS